MNCSVLRRAHSMRTRWSHWSVCSIGAARTHSDTYENDPTFIYLFILFRCALHCIGLYWIRSICFRSTNQRIIFFSKLINAHHVHQQFGADNFEHIALTLLARESHQNIEVLRQLLETIHNLLSCVTSADTAVPTNVYLATIAHNAHRQQRFLAVLLSLMNEHVSELAQDYYVKYYVTQIMNLVLHEVDNISTDDEAFVELANVVQQSMMQDAGVLNLVPLVKGSQEILRNEGLLLFDTLTRLCTRWSHISGQSSELPKIIAFEGIFERLFQIIAEESGNISGALIVNHCLQIMHNLLRGNRMNQKYFREIGCIRHLHALLLADMHDENTPYSSNIAQGVLDTVQVLVDDECDNPTATKNAIVKNNLLDILTSIALSRGFSDETSHTRTDERQTATHNLEIEMRAMHVLGLVIHLHRPSQEYIESKTFAVSGEHHEGALVRLVRIALYEYNDLRRQGAHSCLFRFLDGNDEGQLMIATTMKAPKLISSGAEEAMLCGITLANALFSFSQPRYSLYESYYASEILRTILQQNEKCKSVLLEIPYEIKQGKPPITFFDCVVRSSIQAIRSRAEEVNCIGLLQLLCVWITDSQEAARRFVSLTSNVVFYLEIVSSAHAIQHTSIHITGLSALLLGIVALEHPEPSEDDTFNIGGYDKESLVEVLLQRVGLKRIAEHWQRLCSSEPFKQAFTPPEQQQGGDKSVYDVQQAQFCINTYRKIESLLEDEQLAKKQQERKLRKDDIQERQRQKKKEGKIVESEQDQETGDSEVTSQQPSSSLSSVNEELKQSAFSSMIDEKVINRYKDLLKEQEDLVHQWQEKHDGVVCERDTILQREKQAQDRIIMLEKQLTESHEQMEQLRDQQCIIQEEHNTKQDELKRELLEKDSAMKVHAKEHTAQLNALQQLIDELNEQLDQKALEMETIQQSFGQMEEMMNDRENELVQLREQFRERGDRLGVIERENHDLNNELTRLRHQAEQMERERGQSSAELELSYQVQQRALQSLQDQLAESQSLLSQKDSQIEYFNQQIQQIQADTEMMRQQMTQQLYQATEQLEAVQHALQERDSTIQQQSTNAHQLHQQQQLLQEAHSTLQLQYAQLEQQCKLMEQQHLQQQSQQPQELSDEERSRLQALLEEKVKKIEELEGDLEDMMLIIEDQEKQLKERV